MRIPELPTTWTISLLSLCLVGLRFMGIDSWTTAALSMIIGYMTGKHIENSAIRRNENGRG